MKLPAKKDYPDYYEIIKKPIDINKILNRIEDGKVKILKLLKILKLFYTAKNLMYKKGMWFSWSQARTKFLTHSHVLTRVKEFQR